MWANAVLSLHSIQAETYSARDTVALTLPSGDALTELEALMSQVFTHRAENAPHIP